ncbi:MAG: ATP-binding protein, partial [Bacteroidetes bacterium]|nr:ATP-binding protein [Bacteroidota bacterium]
MTLFKPAVKHESKLRLAIAGPSGSGKTYSALAIGTALGKTAVVDTEHGSAAKYADRFPFDVLEMEAPFHPDRFVEAIAAAANAGYEVLIIDSLSHAWNGAGGLLEIVDQIAKRMKTANSFAAWKDATPIQNALIEAIVGARIHIIATMRSKQEYVLEQVERNGRTINQPKKVGMAPVQRDSMEYEFDVYLDMTIENDAIVQKTRCPALSGQVINKPGTQLATILREWLSGAPAPTRDDTLVDLTNAKTLNAWAASAYKLPEVRNAFESAQRVADWYGFAVGDFDASH